MTSEFKMTFKMTVRESGDVVCYKHDGQRFEQTQTVKLNADTAYELRFTLQPALYIDKLMINGELHKLELLKSSKHDCQDARTYRTWYETVGYDISERGKRKEFLLVLELQNGVYMKFCLQCKVYKAGENNHALWGHKLSAIDMECKMAPGHNYVTIVKEKYL